MLCPTSAKWKDLCADGKLQRRPAGPTESAIGIRGLARRAHARGSGLDLSRARGSADRPRCAHLGRRGHHRSALGGGVRLDPGERPIPVGAVGGYSFGRMAVASCSSSGREGGAPAGLTAIRR